MLDDETTASGQPTASGRPTASTTAATGTAAFAVDAGGDLAVGPLELEAGAVQAEATGFDGILMTETRHDPFVALALAARATRRIRVSSAIAVAFARNPMTTAVLANDLQLVSGGRFVLGLGSQVKPHIERRFSMPWGQPAKRMREYVEALRAIWASWETGERLDFRGEFYGHTLMSPMFSPGPNPCGNPRITLAAVGTLMTESAGEVADGFLAHSFTTARYLREVSLPALARGRERARAASAVEAGSGTGVGTGTGTEAGVAGAAAHAASPVEVSLPALVALGTTDAELDVAIAAIRKQIAFYGSTPAYKGVLELHGWDGLHAELHALSVKGEWDAMTTLITDDVLAEFAAVGTPAEVAAQLADRYSGLVQRLSFSTPYPVAPELWPALLTDLRAR